MVYLECDLNRKINLIFPYYIISLSQLSSFSHEDIKRWSIRKITNVSVMFAICAKIATNVVRMHKLLNVAECVIWCVIKSQQIQNGLIGAIFHPLFVPRKKKNSAKKNTIMTNYLVFLASLIDKTSKTFMRFSYLVFLINPWT